MVHTRIVVGCDVRSRHSICSLLNSICFSIFCAIMSSTVAGAGGRLPEWPMVGPSVRFSLSLLPVFRYIASHSSVPYSVIILNGFVLTELVRTRRATTTAIEHFVIIFLPFPFSLQRSPPSVAHRPESIPPLLPSLSFCRRRRCRRTTVQIYGTLTG